MLFSDILLDLDTGDASMHDVHVKEAQGKINVASAIFEYAATLAECPENSAFVQEAAEAAFAKTKHDAQIRYEKLVKKVNDQN